MCFIRIKRHNYRFNFVISDPNGTQTTVSEIRKSWKGAIIHSSFTMGQEKIVKTTSFFYTVNYKFIIRDYRWYPGNTAFVQDFVQNLPIHFWA